MEAPQRRSRLQAVLLIRGGEELVPTLMRSTRGLATSRVRVLRRRRVEGDGLRRRRDRQGLAERTSRGTGFQRLLVAQRRLLRNGWSAAELRKRLSGGEQGQPACGYAGTDDLPSSEIRPLLFLLRLL